MSYRVMIDPNRERDMLRCLVNIHDHVETAELREEVRKFLGCFSVYRTSIYLASTLATVFHKEKIRNGGELYASNR